MKKIQVTCALSGFRHVAKMCLVGWLVASNCFTKPKPRPRLQPVIKIEFIIQFSSKYRAFVPIPDMSLSQSVTLSGQATRLFLYLFAVYCRNCLSKFNTQHTSPRGLYAVNRSSLLFRTHNSIDRSTKRPTEKKREQKA